MTATSSSTFRLLPESASSFAGRLDLLVAFLTITSALLTLAVFALVIYFGLRYRRRHEDEVPPESKTPRWLEVTTASGLFVLFVAMFLWGAVIYIDMKRPAPAALEIEVVAKQWMWKTQHPGGQREINALHVPLGRPVKLVMSSQDVIHSFGVPAMRIKQDVLPGSFTTQWFTPTQIGAFDLFCNEYCGTDHSQMRGRVVVLREADYQAWLAGVPADDPPAAAGAKLFSSFGCAQCHGQTAPTLAGLYGRRVQLEDGTTAIADEAYLRTAILDPAAQVVTGYGRLMPSYRNQLSTEQVGALIAYIRTLGVARSDEPTAERTDVAAPASHPTNAIAPQDIPNVPPARQPPPVLRAPINGGGAR